LKVLSIIIPCFNEEIFIARVLKRVHEIQLNNSINKEIIVVDDGSTDKTFEIIQGFMNQQKGICLKTLRHEKNLGKGASIKSAIKEVTGEVIVIQDADLEYDPKDYNNMLQPIIDGKADVVFGSRFKGSNPHIEPFPFHTIVNKFFSVFSNAFTGQKLTDIHTCYKMFRTGVLKNIEFREKRFGFDPEITARLSKIKHLKIGEVPISYYGRKYSEGKKINWIDAMRALFCIVKYNLFP